MTETSRTMTLSQSDLKREAFEKFRGDVGAVISKVNLGSQPLCLHQLNVRSSLYCVATSPIMVVDSGTGCERTPAVV